ncbi:MAG: immune inhibitor A [Bacteroidota bacterium]|nr:immune inhibitor A [Bacteroidota bacterium]
MKMSIKFFGKAAAMAVAAAFIFTACSEEHAPVQNSLQGERDGERTPGLMKTLGTTIGTLNPAVNPGGGSCSIDYTTAGMGQPAVWVGKSYDLSAWAGKNVKIIFHFDTRDGNYNKHEGWYVDDINVDGIADDVESGAGAWTTTGYWHISTTRAASGSSSWRYANSATGTFQGATINSNCSDQRNSGTLTSGVIGLGANPTLTFNTLFAIEGVQPDSYDLMRIEVEEVGVLPAAIDVKPGGCPNPFNVKAPGTLPVAILGSSSFDVTDVNASTVKLAGVMNGPQAPLAGDVGTPYGMMPMDCMDCNASGADGFTDWTFYFASPDVATAIDPVDDGDCETVMVTGRLTSNGAWFAGYDVLSIIKKGK